MAPPESPRNPVRRMAVKGLPTLPMTTVRLPTGAVFLSYAHEDAEAAARIGEALPPSPERYGATRRAFSQR